ncbi:MAG: hypothetical protein H0X24_00335 [Ktedonobacterales bacterium]|nr:hypothetical protein [Ktedonobacterales bacterium]
MDVLYNILAQRGEQGLTLTLLDPLSIPEGPHTPLRFTRGDGIEVSGQVYWQMLPLPTPTERAALLARIHRIVERNPRDPTGPDWDGTSQNSTDHD